MGINLKKFTDFIAPEIDEDDTEKTNNSINTEPISVYEKKDESGISADSNIVLFEPRRFDEAEQIAKHIISNRACCINFHNMPNEYRTRAVDFLSGVIYGVDGTIQKVSDDVILCSPKNLKVGGTINTRNSND